MFWILPLMQLFVVMICWGKCTSQYPFSATLVFISSGMCLQITNIAMQHISSDTDISSYHLADQVLIVTMRDGIIPIMVLFGLLTPIIAVPIGMNIKLARLVVVFNSLVTLNTCWHIRANMNENSDNFVIRLARFRINMLTFALLTFAGYYSCFPAAEIGDAFVKRMDSDIQADAILNNVLKNSIAGAACLIEMEQDDQELYPCQHCGIRHRLTQARHQLLHSMRWCMSRQVLVDLASGSYQSIKTSVDLPLFLKEVGNVHGHCESIISTSTDNGSGVESSVKFDEEMARVALENALFNAAAHKDGGMVTLTAHVCKLGEVFFFFFFF
jgi:hypothetical protein